MARSRKNYTSVVAASPVDRLKCRLAHLKAAHAKAKKAKKKNVFQEVPVVEISHSGVRMVEVRPDSTMIICASSTGKVFARRKKKGC